MRTNSLCVWLGNIIFEHIFVKRYVDILKDVSAILTQYQSKAKSIFARNAYFVA